MASKILQKFPLSLGASGSVGNKRWIILVLLFFATALNYIDRQIISILKPTLSAEFDWSEIDYANIVFSFQLAYTIGYACIGRFMDVFGNKKGFFLCVLVWSAACAAHGLVRSISGFITARFFLGLAEPGNWTGCLKAVRMWFPKSERGFAIGVYNAAANVGAMIAPFVITWLTITWGWPAAFIVPGVLGFIWVVAWGRFYHSVDDHPTLSEQERNHIRSEPEPAAAPKASYSAILRLSTTWAFSIGNLVPTTVFWFYLFWLPDFLVKSYGIQLADLGWLLLIIYAGASVGSLGGGSLSSWFITRGMNVVSARKLVMLLAILFILPISAAPYAGSLLGCTAIITVAIAAHQSWTVNIWSLVTDNLPEHVVGSVFGLGGMLTSIAGMVLAKVVGHVLQGPGGYQSIFVSIPLIYLVSLLLLHLLMPKQPERV